LFPFHYDEAVTKGWVQLGDRLEGVSSDSADFWRGVIEAFSDGVCITDRGGVHVEVNEALCRMTGFSRHELVGGTPPFPYWSAEGMSDICASFERTFRGDAREFELVFRRKSGESFPALVHPSEIAGPDGTTLFYLATVKDISERKRMEIELQRSEQRWRSIAENPFDFVVVIDRQYRYTYVNHPAPGVSREDLIGRATIFDHVDAADHPVMREALDAAFRDGVATSYDVFVPRLNRWFGSVVGPIFEAGEVTSLSILTRDVTPRKRAEESLRQSEHRLQLALDGGDVGAFDLNVATGELFYSPRLYALLGYADGDPTLSRQAGEFRARLHADDLSPTLEALGRALQADGPFDAEFRLRTATGEHRWFHGRGRSFGQTGGAVHFSGFLTDVTARKVEAEERRQMELKLRHAQKLETLGTLAGGIAHDFNNLLVPILGNVQLALRTIDPASPVREELEDILQAASRARELVRRILVFGRRSDERREPIHLPDLIHEVLSLLKASMPANVQIAARITGDCPRVMGDPNQIHQALTNVCTNAYQALGARPGEIDVIVEPVRLESGPAVRISVWDDGPGISSAILERIFDPFFTTKAAGEGSGLGLSMVHAIVTQHGGTVTAHSEEGGGALFQLCFPVSEQAGVARAVPVAALASRVTPRRILCVDDEPAVLRALVRILEHAGHAVTALASADEALRRVRARPDAFDLVMTDLTMPEMRGIELAARLAELRADLPIILVTGYGEATLVPGAISGNVRLCLGKPVDVDDLLAGVEQVLGEQRPAW
jgi:two-component system cell cycle sensor histidine kinase/response regulator CckA